MHRAVSGVDDYGLILGFSLFLSTGNILYVYHWQSYRNPAEVIYLMISLRLLFDKCISTDDVIRLG